MTQPAPEPETTPADSTSTTPPPASSSTPPRREPLRAKPWTVRRPTPSTTTTSNPQGGLDGGNAAERDDPLDDEPDSSTRSSDQQPTQPLRLDKKPLAEVFRGGVIASGQGAHQLLARTPHEQAEGVWLIEEREAGKIADPLAKVAERHAGGGLAVTNDVGDLLEAGLYVLAYLFRNGVKAWQIRRAYKQMSEHGILPSGEPEEGDPQ